MLKFMYLDVEPTRAPSFLFFTVCRILRSNVRGLSKMLSDLNMTFSQYDDISLVETLVSDLCHVSDSLVPGFGHTVLCRDRMSRALGLATYMRDEYGAFRQHEFSCDCSEMLVFRVCGAKQNFYVFSLYHNPDLDDWIYD